MLKELKHHVGVVCTPFSNGLEWESLDVEVCTKHQKKLMDENRHNSVRLIFAKKNRQTLVLFTISVLTHFDFV